jgi:hypothetical protein
VDMIRHDHEGVQLISVELAISWRKAATTNRAISGRRRNSGPLLPLSRSRSIVTNALPEVACCSGGNTRLAGRLPCNRNVTKRG